MTMKILGLILLATTLTASAWAQNAVSSSTPPSLTAGQSRPLNQTLTGGLRVQPMDGAGNDVSQSNPLPVNSRLSPTLSTPTSTLAPPSNTAAYTANMQIANSATAGSVVVPTFAIATANGGAVIPRLRLFVADAAAGWNGVQVQVDLWSAAPTFTSADHVAFAVATGMASHLGSYVISLNSGGDGASGEGAVSPGNAAMVTLSGSSIYWTAKVLSATTGTITATHNLTLTAEVSN